ncbi:hypothetical protein IE53DRAFT_410402 [Violaceomyces palustris]|uniref:Uncharacterized protein n=1 Tax=Violaceomyces palustris TaxID=1673888 RepID=A0ACD0NZ72_9BASI|nr:hypothetical protein IE53DRAFT_410402 [Violaceomyces palustris]
MSEKPPFHMPGHWWDPERKRFFKSETRGGGGGGGGGGEGGGSRKVPKRRSQTEVEGRGKRREEEVVVVEEDDRHLFLNLFKARGRPTLSNAEGFVRRFQRGLIKDSMERMRLVDKIPIIHAGLLERRGKEEEEEVYIVKMMFHRKEGTHLVGLSDGSVWSLDLARRIVLKRISPLCSFNHAKVDLLDRDGSAFITEPWRQGGAGYWRTGAGGPRSVEVPRGGDIFCCSFLLGHGDSDRRGEIGGCVSDVFVSMGVGPSAIVWEASPTEDGQDQQQRWKGVRLPSDVMAVELASKELLFCGTRSGQVWATQLSKLDVRLGTPTRQMSAWPWCSKVSRCVSAHESNGTRGSVTNIETVQDGREVLVAWTSGQIMLFKLEGFERVREFQGHSNSFHQGLGFCVERRYGIFAAAGEDHRIRVWNLDDPLPINRNSSETRERGGLSSYEFRGKVTSLSFSPRKARIEEPGRGGGEEGEGDGSMDGLPALHVGVGRVLHVFE